MAISRGKFELVSAYTHTNIGSLDLTSDVFIPVSGSEDLTPIIKHFGIGRRKEISFVNEASYDSGVSTWDSISKPRLSHAVVEDEYIDVTSNDLQQPTTMFVLNFTSAALNVMDQYGFIKTYASLQCRELDKYTGSILFIRVHSLNRGRFIERGTKRVSSITEILDYLKTNPDAKDIRGNDEVYKLLTSVEDVIQKTGKGSRANSIQVVSVLKLSTEETVYVREGHPLFVQEASIMLSTGLMEDLPCNPLIDNVSFTRSDFKEVSESLNFNMFINDNGNNIGDRFACVLGEVIKIPKVDLKLMQEGLTVVIRNKEGITHKKFFTFEEMKSLEFIYNNKEDAEAGARELERLRENNSLESERLKNKRVEAESYNLDAKTKHMDLLRQLELEKEEYRKEVEALKITKQEEENLWAIKVREWENQEREWNRLDKEREREHLRLEKEWEKEQQRLKTEWERIQDQNKAEWERIQDQDKAEWERIQDQDKAEWSREQERLEREQERIEKEFELLQAKTLAEHKAQLEAEKLKRETEVFNMKAEFEKESLQTKAQIEQLKVIADENKALYDKEKQENELRISQQKEAFETKRERLKHEYDAEKRELERKAEKRKEKR